MRRFLTGFSTFMLFLCFVLFLGAGEVRVMTWNLGDMDLFDGAGAGRVPWQLETETEIASVIRAVNPDICFLTEAPSYVELLAFTSRNGLDYTVSHFRQQSGHRDFADGMALLSRKAPEKADLMTPPVPGSTRSSETAYLDWSYRGVVHAVYEGFSLLGVHLKSPWDGKRRSYEIRNAQIHGLLDYLETFGGPLILLGDFNDGPGRDGKETSFGFPDSLGTLELHMERAPGRGAETQEKGYNLDHIFVHDAEVGIRNVIDTDWDLSDHRPVWADIKY